MACSKSVQTLHAAVNISSQGQSSRSNILTSIRLIAPSKIHSIT